MRLLVSVRTAREAVQAAAAGADIVDLKEPRSGALGALPVARIAAIVTALRTRFPELPSSATTGDFDAGAADEMLGAVDAVGRCGVDYVKVGIAPGAGAGALLQRLARSPHRIVPVLLGDEGVDLALWQDACCMGFAAIMVDTRDKRSGSLLDCVKPPVLRDMLAVARDHRRSVGLAGSLRVAHVPVLRRLAPDIAGFRGAVCRGERTGALEPNRVRDLARALRGESLAESDALCVAQ